MKITKTPKADPADKTIGEFVAAYYRTAKVFERYGIDFCCGGKISLSAICKEKELDLETILAEIDSIKNMPNEQGHDYDDWELPVLIDYIINAHHAYLRANTDQILSYAQKIAEVHGSNYSEFHQIALIFNKIATDMAVHLKIEETVLFPSIKKIVSTANIGDASEKENIDSILATLSKLNQEHEETGDSVHEIRHLAKDYAIPEDACNTFMLTYQKLKEFEDDLHKHVHLENNILFPKQHYTDNFSMVSK